ncbi:uncharacterized protein LOC128786856 [Vidua chalybeata]|uniref:uncharacterized protein LOC128786856 n=1 Tax=Vidua chalybeata TaxID=81927 RepID=UPI0023A7C8D2|nr:uncharacterized protein LOC128786856 [Vidua chalybeata]
MDQELSQCREVTSQDLCLWEEVTVQEFYQQQEAFPCGVVRHQEWHQCKVGVRVQWGDGTQQELEMFHWEENVTVQDLSQWDTEDETYQKLSQLEEDLTYQELSLWEGEGHQEISPLEKDFQSPMHMYQWEKEKREPEFSQVGDSSEKEVCQGKDYSLQKLAQWEKDSSDQKLSQRNESVSSQGLSQWGESARYKIYDKPLQPEKDKDTQTCARQGPGSPSSVGTRVAAEAACELPSASPALGSPTEDELAAAAAPAGAAEKLEEPLEPLAPKMEKAPGSPARSGELELSQGDSEEGPELSQGEMGKYQKESQREACIEQKVSLEESGSYQEGSQGEARTEQVLSQVESGSHQEGSQGEDSTEQELSQGESSSHQKVSESIEKRLSQGDTSSYFDLYFDLSDWDECSKEELSQGDRDSYEDFSDWEEYPEQGHSQGETSSFLYPSDWEEYSETELSYGDVENYQEPSDWEESVSLEFSEEEDSSSHVASSSDKTSSGKSSWESDSDQDLVQDSWEENTGAKPLLQEDDEWDERSVLELREDEDREGRAAGLTGDGFPMPVPCKAWAEYGASGLCLGGPLCALSPHLEAPAPRGHTASPAFQEQVPEAGTQSLMHAPGSHPSPSAPQPGPRVPHKKHPSNLRWALHSLFHCPCLAPQTED